MITGTGGEPAGSARPRGAARHAPVPVEGWLHGVRIRGHLPPVFASHLRSATAQPNRELAREREPLALAVSWLEDHRVPAGETIWSSLEKGAGERFALSRFEGGVRLEVETPESLGVFLLERKRIAISWSGDSSEAARYLVSHAVPIWLELGGVLVLHASAVCLARQAVAFLAPSGEGKSTLCAELVRLGCDLLTDDGLAVRETAHASWTASAGPPYLRLWPSALRERLGQAGETLPRVRPDGEKRLWRPAAAESAFNGDEALDLACVYVLDRFGRPGGSAVRSQRLPPRLALVRLLAGSLAGSPAAALGLSGQRFERMTRLASAVALRTLDVPTGDDCAEEVLHCVRRDLLEGGQPQ